MYSHREGVSIIQMSVRRCSLCTWLTLNCTSLFQRKFETALTLIISSKDFCQDIEKSGKSNYYTWVTFLCNLFRVTNKKSERCQPGHIICLQSGYNPPTTSFEKGDFTKFHFMLDGVLEILSLLFSKGTQFTFLYKGLFTLADIQEYVEDRISTFSSLFFYNNFLNRQLWIECYVLQCYVMYLHENIVNGLLALQILWIWMK